ncbi:Sec-independent protein translocase subunit TatA/TatB [Sphingobacterium wenxiniae]|uniref:Sec-independent protein translocase protein TatA n=1 Tax=Sphingobacterium wenxiniae TaxID=683125 RepID=A0A1I6VF46_9SPHI|nr:twin-arginine translocase TatA/TatE family subunit [Sphingobacterium wenxiniae]SFT12319.1 mttA/Hcf106 family protein [Sphingobacterium wenxiniae]
MSLAFMNIGTQEMVLIVIVILLLFGGKKLPELARGLGRGIREFKDASEGIKQEISDQINNFEKDLDVTVEDKPAAKTHPTSAAIANEINQQAEVGTEEVAKVEETEEVKKSFPQFTAPENTYQHNPGQQPSSGEEHYTYGYNDHFANSEESNVEEATASESSDAPVSDEQTKNA